MPPGSTPTTEALLHLARIAEDAGQHIRRSTTLKPDEAALLVAEIARLRLLAGEEAGARMHPPAPPAHLAQAAWTI